MDDLNARKQKFLEMLLTLGSLLAIFLGFVVEKTGVLLNYLVTFGLLFAISALVSYTASLFPEWVRGRWKRLGIRSVYTLLAASMGGLFSLGTAYVLGLNIPGNTLDWGQTAMVGVVYLVSFLGVMELIQIVMRTEVQPT